MERTEFVGALAAGELSRPAYCRYLRSLHPLYEGLESALRRGAGQEPVLTALWIPALARAGPLASDLRTLHGPGWRREIRPVPAARAYGRRLASLARDAPHRLAAHCYLRYMGDLSGGRMLRPAVADALDLDGAGTDGPVPGLAFYDFPDLGRDVPSFREDYRSRLDGLELSAPEEEEIVEEAIRGYEAHGDLFRQLADLSREPGE